MHLVCIGGIQGMLSPGGAGRWRTFGRMRSAGAGTTGAATPSRTTTPRW